MMILVVGSRRDCSCSGGWQALYVQMTVVAATNQATPLDQSGGRAVRWETNTNEVGGRLGGNKK